MMRDMKSNIDVGVSLHPAARAASGTGTGVDLRGYDGALCVINFGAWTDGTHTPKLQESDTDVGTAYTDVGTADQLGTFSAISGTAGSNSVQRVGYIGSKRYVRAFITVASGTTGALSGANIVRGEPRQAPLS